MEFVLLRRDETYIFEILLWCNTKTLAGVLIVKVIGFGKLKLSWLKCGWKAFRRSRNNTRITFDLVCKLYYLFIVIFSFLTKLARGSISIQILIVWPLKWCAREPGLLCSNHEILSVGRLLCLNAQYLKDHISDTYLQKLQQNNHCNEQAFEKKRAVKKRFKMHLLKKRNWPRTLL